MSMWDVIHGQIYSEFCTPKFDVDGPKYCGETVQSWKSHHTFYLSYIMLRVLSKVVLEGAFKLSDYSKLKYGCLKICKLLLVTADIVCQGIHSRNHRWQFFYLSGVANQYCHPKMIACLSSHRVWWVRNSELICQNLQYWPFKRWIFCPRDLEMQDTCLQINSFVLSYRVLCTS